MPAGLLQELNAGIWLGRPNRQASENSDGPYDVTPIYELPKVKISWRYHRFAPYFITTISCIGG